MIRIRFFGPETLIQKYLRAAQLVLSSQRCCISRNSIALSFSQKEDKKKKAQPVHVDEVERAQLPGEAGGRSARGHCTAGAAEEHGLRGHRASQVAGRVTFSHVCPHRRRIRTKIAVQLEDPNRVYVDEVERALLPGEAGGRPA